MNNRILGSSIFTFASTGTFSLASIYGSQGGMQTANRVDIQASINNSNIVVIGDGSVKSDQSTGGIALSKGDGMSPGDAYLIEKIRDLQTIYVAGTMNDSICFNWWIGEVN